MAESIFILSTTNENQNVKSEIRMSKSLAQTWIAGQEDIHDSRQMPQRARSIREKSRQGRPKQIFNFQNSNDQNWMYN